MRKEQVRTAEQALSYITDCTLATVCDLASKKSRGAGEFVRQKAIAQSAILWIIEFGSYSPDSRVAEVVEQFNKSVDEWAKQYDVRHQKELS